MLLCLKISGASSQKFSCIIVWMSSRKFLIRMETRSGKLEDGKIYHMGGILLTIGGEVGSMIYKEAVYSILVGAAYKRLLSETKNSYRLRSNLLQYVYTVISVADISAARRFYEELFGNREVIKSYRKNIAFTCKCSVAEF